MKHKTNPIFKIMIICIIHLLTSCEEFLDQKPNLSIEAPETKTDLQAILDNESIMNYSTILDIVASDDYYHSLEGFESEDKEIYRNAHIRSFHPDMYGETSNGDWVYPYKQIFAANFCLEKANELIVWDAKTEAINNIMGSAWFIRAYALVELVKVFTPQYSPAAASHLSIPLPLKSDVTTVPDYVSLQKVYDQIFEDLERALPLLPSTPKFRSRPSKSAVYALRARVYLMMKQYEKAFTEADASLAIDDQLMDFNQLNPSLNFPVSLGNVEVIYHTLAPTFTSINVSPEARIDTTLYKSYHDDDLRKSIYFYINPQGHINYKGSFTAGYSFFTGLTVSEMLLIKAECALRLDNPEIAFTALDRLLKSRYKEGHYAPVPYQDLADPLGFVLSERRKEMIFRGRRWADLKRLAGERTELFPIVRKLGDQEYVMGEEPDSFVFPIPEEELQNR